VEKKFLLDEQIKAEKVRVIKEDGTNLGVFSFEEALKLAKDQNLNLILISDKANPPVCKIADFGKFLYSLRKKEKDKKKKETEVKGVRIGYNTSLHDLEIKANQAKKFLEKGHKVMVEMILRGREKELKDFALEKMKKFLEILNSKIEIKTEGEIKFLPRGLVAIVQKKQ
jgi:translation initiation factor IF-3